MKSVRSGAQATASILLASLAMACGPRPGDDGAAGRSVASPSPETRSDSPATVAGAPQKQVRPIRVMIAGQPCNHGVLPMSERFDKSDGDEVEWQVTNGGGCNSDQKVLICNYRKAPPGLLNPFRPCVSSPTPGLDLGRVFVVRSGRGETLNCAADVVGKYENAVFVGNEVPAACPASAPPRDDVARTHVLDTEIFP